MRTPMKPSRRTCLLAGMTVILSMAACGSPSSTGGSSDPASPTSSSGSSSLSNETPEVAAGGGDGRTLIVYFSKTGNTENVANQIQELTGGDMFKIEPVNPYPVDYQETTEIARDELDRNARPEVRGTVANMDDYDTIIVGYPIWWSQAPMPVLTFLESHDLSGKTIAPFATAASSGIEGSINMLQDSAPGSTFLDGQRVRSDDEIQPWLQQIGILQS